MGQDFPARGIALAVRSSLSTELVTKAARGLKTNTRCSVALGMERKGPSNGLLQKFELLVHLLSLHPRFSHKRLRTRDRGVRTSWERISWLRSSHQATVHSEEACFWLKQYHCVSDE